MDQLTYSEFDKFSINVFSANETDIQLPSIKNKNNSDAYAIYIHSLIKASIFSSLKKDIEEQDTETKQEMADPFEDPVEDDVPEYIHGWLYRYDITENDYLKYILTQIIEENPVVSLKAHNEYKIYTKLIDKQVNFYSLMYHDLNRSFIPYDVKCCDDRFPIPNLWGVFWDPLSPTKYKHTHNYSSQNYYHNSSFRPVGISNLNQVPQILNQKTVPGLTFKFDNKNHFVAAVLDPLPKKLNNIRKEYAQQLLALITDNIDFINFAEFISEFAINFVYRPKAQIYHHINNVENHISQKLKCGYRIKAVKEREIPESLMINYMNSIWTDLFFTEDIGEPDEFINIDQLTQFYKKRDSRIELQTLYISSISNAFIIPLDTYKEIREGGDLILVVPYELYRELKESVVRLWMYTGKFN